MEVSRSAVIRSTSSSVYVQNDWDKIAESSQFQALVKKKKAFLIPTIILFLIYFFALPVMAGYFKPLMLKKIPGFVNFAYLFSVSQFIVAWALAYIYTKKANQFDDMISQINGNKKEGVQ